MRPHSLASFFGQSHLLAPGKPLRKAIESNHLHSMIFWGPPGTGKTTLASIIAEKEHAAFDALSAVMAGVKDIRQAVERAKVRKEQSGQATILFIDEVHRFNKAQQDGFLPFVEEGVVTFIGATTENPSFELNKALLSRARVYVFKRLSDKELIEVLQQALNDKEKGLGELDLHIVPDDLKRLALVSDGDARCALNLLEIASDMAETISGKLTVTDEIMHELLVHAPRVFDKQGEVFYDQISALHKAVRGSDPDASLYWLCRMLDGGCDPLYIARRTIRMATEDIGNADPRALEIALNAWDVVERLGSPEGELALAQAIIYMACAAKSNASYMAYNKAMAFVKSSASFEVPLHLRNAPTQLMKELGYSKAYRYAHDEPNAYAAGEHYFPEDINQPVFYEPVSRGLEIKIREKLAFLKSLDEAVKGKKR